MNKEKPSSKFTEQEQAKLDELRAETEIGRNMAGRLLQFYGSVGDEGLLDYLNSLSAVMGKKSDAPERQYMIAVLDTDIVNAFACPGGYILLTKGAIKHAMNEAELGFVIGHEISHVSHRHMFDRLKEMTPEEMEQANRLTNKGFGDNVFLQSRMRPKPETSEFAESVAKYLSSGAIGLSIVKAAGAGMSLMLETGLGADKEFEADQLGFLYSASTGYHPAAGFQYLCRLQNKSGKVDDFGCKWSRKGDASDDRAKVMAKTHPPLSKRLDALQKMLGELDQAEGAVLKKRFEARTQSVKKL